jgi:tetratricopeptide (TPR) repeat protein
MGCHISIVLTGYEQFTGYVEDGTLIKLRRVGPQHEGGSAISAAQLKIPGDAKKEYEVGEAAVAKKKWLKAEAHFRAAIALYPKYAMAWSELGQTLQEQDRKNEALAAFNKALEADPSYAKALVQVCLADGLQQRWKEELQTSEEAVRLNAIEFPAAYYCHAEAVFHMGEVETAESFARQALRLDPSRTFFESLVLLGQIFEKQGNAHDAAIEYRNYLQLTPHGTKASEARDGLARLNPVP